MTTHKTHDKHNHKHEAGCGHPAIRHRDHTDYLHDGHLHSLHEGHVDEHVLEVSEENPVSCTSGHACSTHESTHQHGPGCGHSAVPHGDHFDFLVEGHLHHFHEDAQGSHCDDHGRVSLVA